MPKRVDDVPEVAEIPDVIAKQKPKKLAIVGFAPSYKEAPWTSSPEEVEIWVLNEMYKLAPQIPGFRADRWFEIHDLNSPSKAIPEHQQFLMQCPVSLYVQRKYDHLPNANIFPFYEIVDYFEKKRLQGARYFTNSISWFIAYAILEGFEEIQIFGVNMSTDSEYGYQKPSCEYWMGYAEGLGIKLFIPESSELLKAAALYGIESNNKLTAWIKEQVKELKQRGKGFQMQQAQAEQAAKQNEIAQAELRGAVQAYGEILKRRQ